MQKMAKSYLVISSSTDTNSLFCLFSMSVCISLAKELSAPLHFAGSSPQSLCDKSVTPPLILLTQQNKNTFRTGSHERKGEKIMKKNIITTAATIIASAMVFVSATSITAFASGYYTYGQAPQTTYTQVAPAPAPQAPAAYSPQAPAAPAQAAGVTQDQALQIALDHAGYKKSDVAFPSVHKDFDDGWEKWEVKFHVGFYEYNYDIAVANGQILEFEIDD